MALIYWQLMVDKEQQMVKQVYVNLVILLFISEDIATKKK